MSDKKEEFERIEFPEIHTLQFDKKCCHIYLDLYDKIMEKEYMLMIDMYEFINWIGEKEIKEIKKSLINEIKSK